MSIRSISFSSKRFLLKLFGSNLFEGHFNTPIKFHRGKISAMNERIVEIPFLFQRLLGFDKLKVLDFGCTKNWLSLALASLGHEIYAVDLRPYEYEHPNLKFYCGNILNYHESDFDLILAISVIEHVGLGAYKENPDDKALMLVIKCLASKLKENGIMVVTVPVGCASVDPFERSFEPDSVVEIFQECGLVIDEEKFYRRIDGVTWIPCNRKEISQIDNSLKARSKFGSGVNGVGCYVFRKINNESFI